MVTGSRTWTHTASVYEALLAVAGKEDTLVVGDAPGADRIATLFWMHYTTPEQVEVYRADWARFGNQAGPLRNRDMVLSRPDLVLAFLMPCTDPRCARPRPHGTHGTINAIRQAQKARIQVTIHQGKGLTS